MTSVSDPHPVEITVIAARRRPPRLLPVPRRRGRILQASEGPRGGPGSPGGALAQAAQMHRAPASASTAAARPGGSVGGLVSQRTTARPWRRPGSPPDGGVISPGDGQSARRAGGDQRQWWFPPACPLSRKVEEGQRVPPNLGNSVSSPGPQWAVAGNSWCQYHDTVAGECQGPQRRCSAVFIGRPRPDHGSQPPPTRARPVLACSSEADLDL